MKPVAVNTNIFGTNQQIEWSVTTYDTPHTINSKGMIYRPATPTSSFGNGINFETATDAQLTTHFNDNTIPGIIDNDGFEVLGRIPLIYDYWGAGAPIGVRTAGRAAIRVRGLVKETGTYGLAVLGRGNVKIFQNNTEILYGNFTELLPAYTTSMQSMSAGDEIEIYFWSLDQQWAGWAIRVFTDSNVISGGELDWDLLRETDILSASFMDSGETITETIIEEVEEVQFENRISHAPRCSIALTASYKNDIFGWYWDFASNSLKNRFDSAPEVKIGHRIRIKGPFTGEQYNEFTGYIDDIVPQSNTIVITCTGWEGRLAKQISENYPDRLSYAAFGYTDREGTENPAWNVPAYDHWPYEYAIKDLLYRAWIDPSLMNAKRQFLRVGETTPEDGDFGTFRARSLTGTPIRIERQAHYGNPEGDPDREPDDPYLTPSKVTESVFTRIKGLVNRIGYIFRSDHNGNIVLKPRNNASGIEQIVHPTDSSNLVHPSAIGGTYANYVGTGWSYVSGDIKASRVDIAVGRGVDLGVIDIDILRLEDSWTDTVTIDTSFTETLFYYDRAVTVNLNNVALFTVLSGADYGTYRLTITPNGGTGSTEYNLDALLIFDADPTTPTSLFALKTFENITELQGQSTTPAHVNDAIVTGFRRNTLTDSEKAKSQISSEYVVSRATDVDAILNPDAINYDGRKITAFLSEESITAQDLADWAATTLVSRHRLPIPEISIQHTVLPVIELFDPVYIEDSAFESFDPNTVRWVTGYVTTYTPTSALTNVELTSFQEIPSYEPREEIDLSLFNNKPVINLNITYPSLDGVNTITNPIQDLAVAASRTVLSGTVTAPSFPAVYGTFSEAVTDTVSPGTELFKITIDGEDSYFKNNPYQKIYEVESTELRLYFEMADGYPQYRFGGWGLSTGQSAEFSYFDIQDVYVASGSPFYDPYYSEFVIPELIEISFDALVSGFYRVSVVDARDKTNPVTVAWLTQPGTDDPDGEKHWEYTPAGPDKQYAWDGVDNIGRWNRRQSEEYGWRMRGVFEDIDQPEIGAGFYAWNDHGTIPTHISGEIDTGEPAYPIGRFSQFFIKVEVIRDTDELPLVVNSNTAEDVLDTTAAELTERYVYYHLPRPNTVEISIEDWDDSGGDFDPNSPGASWNTTPDNDASFRDGKPVRVTITPTDRLGAKFAGTDFDVNVRLSRVVSLNANVMDQSLVFLGEPWTDLSPAFENKRVLSRRFTTDFTKIFRDQDFLPGSTIDPWTFYPSLFELDFGGGIEEPIEYLNYLQLTETPHWNPQRRIGEKRSRMNFAMVSYLFYLSVYSQDRSGRLAWAIDSNFIDKSKILVNTDTSEFPDFLDRHQRRTVYTRQWWDYPELTSVVGPSGWAVPEDYWGGYSDRWNVADTSSGEELYPIGTDTYRNDNTLTGLSDPYSPTPISKDRLPTTFNSNDRDLGTTGGITRLGNWTWEQPEGILWITNVTRDFHPFYLVPPMALMSRIELVEDGPAIRNLVYWPAKYVYASVVEHPLAIDVPPDEAKHDNWFSIVPEYGSIGTLHSNIEENKMIPGRIVQDFLERDSGPGFGLPDLAAGIVQFQKQDDIQRYENSRGQRSHGPLAARDTISVIGGSPYYLNPIQYRTFDSWVISDSGGNDKRIYLNDIFIDGWFFLTFRHTYNWESSSLFPVSPVRFLLPAAIDADITGSPVVSESLDPGAWVGWKDDHPGVFDEGIWPDSGDCDNLHWRNTHTNFKTGELFGVPLIQSHAGGACSADDPTVAVTGETLRAEYTPDQNIFLQIYRKDTVVYDFSGLSGNVDPRFQVKVLDYYPMAVGPRLPQTRRVLFSLCLENRRRASSVPGI